jgi:hypothetical protein
MAPPTRDTSSALLLALLLLLLSSTATANCARDEDCSLNGACGADGACACFAPWTGDACALLAFGAGPAISGYGVSPRINAWGGNAVFFEGEWHGFFSEMAENCSLADWYRNSLVVHGVAPSPLGPYTRQDVALGVFAHEPQVSLSRAPDGSALFAIWHVGNANGDATPNNCTAGGAVTPAGGGAPAAAAAGGGALAAAASAAAAAAAGSSLHIAPTPAGPWTPITLELPPCNNPSQARRSDGVWFLLCNNAADQRETNGTIFTAPDIVGPWTLYGYAAGPQPEANVPEDGFLFFDARGHWHILYHTYVITKDAKKHASPG